jgi:hypothetical protein
MGEANRKRRAPCRCGSGKPAATCCLSANGWRKAPVVVALKNTGDTGKHDRCYLRETNACSTKISAEHPISEGVLKVLAEKEVQVEGLPWLNGEKKVLRFGNLTTNCLCKAHNSALSPIDDVGGRFFAAIQKSGTSDEGPNQHHLFSGHDVERWLLKAMAGLVVSRNFAVAGAPLNRDAMRKVDFENLLEDTKQWKAPLGMYAMQPLGTKFTRQDVFSLAPLLIPGTNEIAGLVVDVQGLQFGMLAVDTPTKGTRFQNAIYRPGILSFKLGHLTHKIEMSWDDAKGHGEMELTGQR